MTEQQFPNTWGLSTDKIQKLFERMHDPAGTEDGENLRRHPRAARINCDVDVEVEHLGGGVTRARAATRNLSAGGAGILFGGFVHQGSKITINLGRTDGGRDTMQGKVVRCHHLEGRMHLLGVAFDSSIDPTLYIDDDEALKAVREQQLSECPELCGSLLYMTQSDCEYMLVEHLLTNTNLQMKRVNTPGQVMDAVKQDMIDIIQIDADSKLDAVQQLLRQLKEESYAGRIAVWLSNEANTVHQELVGLGSDYVLVKPLTRTRLQAVLMEALERVGCNAGGGDIVSTLKADPGVTDMLKEYVQEAQRLGKSIVEAVSTQDLEAIETACRRLKGTGESYGYEVVSEQAAEALTQLHASMSIRETAPYLQKLSLICSRLMPKAAA